MNLNKKIVAATAGALMLAGAFTLGPVVASSVTESALPEPIKAAAEPFEATQASAADRCKGPRRVPAAGFTGGCENTTTKLVVKCRDGNRVEYKSSAFNKGHHTVYCNGGWPFGFYAAESAYLVPFWF